MEKTKRVPLRTDNLGDRKAYVANESQPYDKFLTKNL